MLLKKSLKNLNNDIFNIYMCNKNMAQSEDKLAEARDNATAFVDHWWRHLLTYFLTHLKFCVTKCLKVF